MVWEIQSARASAWAVVVRGSTTTASWSEWIRVTVDGVQTEGSLSGRGTKGLVGRGLTG